MSLITELKNGVTDALRAKDSLRKTTLRMALAAVKFAEVEKKEELDEDEILRIVQKEVKSRRESIEDAKKAQRPDLIEAAEAEIKILEVFLPKGLSAEELKALVTQTIAEVGASGPGDIGNVMKAVIPKVAGRADGAQISQMVKEILQAN